MGAVQLYHTYKQTQIDMAWLRHIQMWWWWFIKSSFCGYSLCKIIWVFRRQAIAIKSQFLFTPCNLPPPQRVVLLANAKRRIGRKKAAF